MTTYLEMPADLLNQLGKNEKLTREMNYAHGVCNSYSILEFYCTMYEGKRYKTTLEQKQNAAKLYEINKQKAINNVKNKLVFVGMGCEYSERYADDVCNHRIRTEIVNPDGKKFFIEVCTGLGESMRIDFVVNRDQENEYNEKASFYYNEIMANGGFYRTPQSSELMQNYTKYQGQPYYWFKHDAWKDLKVKYTKQNVLDLVNSLFDCHFTEMEVDYLHLTTDNYQSISPSK